MKKIIIILVFAVFALESNAQNFFDAGIKTGLTTSKLSTHKSDYNAQTILNYSAGAFARVNLGRFYIQPEAYFNSKGGEMKRISTSTVDEFDLKTVDVPALLGLKIIDHEALNLRIMAGPVFSFVTDKSVKGQLTEEKLKDNFFGWQYGAGVDFLFLTLDVRMESYNKNFYDTPDFDSKNGIFVISLGAKLF